MATAIDTRDPDMLDLQANRSQTSFLAVLWQRKSLVILGVVLGALMGALFYANKTPVYQSGAQVLVVPRTASVAGPLNSSSATMQFKDDYMSTQQSVLKSEIIARMAVGADESKSIDPAKRNTIRKYFEEQGGFRSFPDATTPEQMIGGLINGLTVTRDQKEAMGGGNSVLVLTFKATDQEECKILLEAIINAYQAFIDDTYKVISESILNQFTRLRTEIEGNIVRVNRELINFIETAPPVFSKTASGGTSIMQKNLQSTAEQVTKWQVECDQKRRDLEAFRKCYKDHGAADTIQLILRNNRIPESGDPELDKMLWNVRMLIQEALSKYGEKHPKVIQLQKQHDDLKQLFTKNIEAPTPDGKPLDLAQKYMRALELDVDALGMRITEMEKVHSERSKELVTLSKYELQENSLKKELARYESQFEAILKQIETQGMQKDNGGFQARMISRPSFGVKVAPQAYQVFTAAGLLGLMLGAGLAYLAEISDKSFRNPMEIRKRLGLPVIGHIPFLAADEKAQSLVAAGSNAVDPMLITHYQSNSIGSEAYRGVRTSLYFSTQGATHKVIQVTSPNVGDGKSTLAANLAVSIAQSGKRTVLIDCDFRKPRVHKIFNVPSQLGMASVMAGQADLNSAIQTTAVPNLSVLPCGPRPVNPAELLTSPKFKELLDELRRTFEFVVVDTPPILVVTDPAVVAPRVDGVVLCIRVTKNGRPYAERAREVLHSLGANVLGVVVNGFGGNAGGGKYGYEHYQYGYGDGYSYTYGYSYGYVDKEAASYYGNNSDEPVAAGKS